jgi:hypothetical protein
MHDRLLRVRLETERHVVEGTLQLPTEGYRSRLTDFLGAHDADFLAVTDAELAWRGAERPAEQHAYLAVSVRHVVLVVELDDLGPAGDAPPERVVTASTPPPRA